MNTRYYMVIIKGEIKTSEIMSCVYNRNTQKWDVKFNTGKTYSYAYLNVEKLTEPDVLNPNMYRISRDGREFFDIKAIYVFRSTYESYWHIHFGDGSERDYRRSDLHIMESCLNQSQSSNVFEYIKEDKVSIGIFPEGSRSKDGQLQEFKPGAFKIAEKALCPVIVCSMKGTINIHKNWPWKKTEIYMDILDVIDPSIWKEKNTVEVSEYAHNLILNNITLS